MTPGNGSYINFKEKCSLNEFDKKLEKFETTIKRAICEFPDQEVMVNCLMKVGHDIDKLLELC